MMWDLSGGDPGGQTPQPSQEERHHHQRSHTKPPEYQSQVQMPSPSMPVPHTRQQLSHSASDSFAYQTSSSYPGFLSPPLTSQPPFTFPMIPGISPNQPPPTTQIIHVYNYSHHSSRHRRHHKHSTSTPVAMPGTVGHSTSYGPPVSSSQPPIHTATYIHNINSPYPSFPSPVSIQPSISHPSPPHNLNTKPSSSGLDGRFQYSKCTGRKKALCIGINYHGQANTLRGCINDARHVRDFLIKYEGFKSGDIVVLTDDSNNPRQLPTKKNILDAMRWLVKRAQPHDSLFFHYSGHGGQLQDMNGDEVDGWDEVIYPLDFKTNGPIVDDDMHDIMVKPLPRGCRLTALFDSCHSGTVLDLPYIYSSHGRLKGRHVSDRSRKQKEAIADVISWSGCKDGQTSADTFADGKAVGAMSHAFIQALKDRPNQSYQDLLQAVRRNLYTKYSQKPQLGSSHPIDTTLKFII